MKNNLSKKIFIITLSLLLGLMIVIFIFQTFFFQSFYELKKKNNLVKDINRFGIGKNLNIENSILIGLLPYMLIKLKIIIALAKH